MDRLTEEQSIASVSQWAETLEPACRDAAIVRIAMRWSWEDTVQCASWIEGLRPGLAKDQAKMSMVWAYYSQNSKNEAIAAANSISDAGIRSKAIRTANATGK